MQDSVLQINSLKMKLSRMAVIFFRGKGQDIVFFNIRGYDFLRLEKQLFVFPAAKGNEMRIPFAARRLLSVGYDVVSFYAVLPFYVMLKLQSSVIAGDSFAVIIEPDSFFSFRSFFLILFFIVSTS